MEKMEKPVSNSPFSPFYAIGPPPPRAPVPYVGPPFLCKSDMNPKR